VRDHPRQIRRIAGPGYAVFGAIAGAVSVVGAGIALIGAWYQRRGLPRLRIDRFAYGWLFAFNCALVRYFTAG
jgi:hypothetical protein